MFLIRLFRSVRRHLSYSNLVATLALFIALGGVSYAAIKIPNNSVGTKQLKKGAVTGAKVKKGSLLARNFKAGQLPRGPEGERGPQGERGPAGPPGGVARFEGPATNGGATPTGSGWEVLQTVSGELSGRNSVFLGGDVSVSCPVGGGACEFETGIRIDGEFAAGSLRLSFVSVPAGSSTVDQFNSFGYYEFSGATEISQIYRQTAGSPATVVPNSPGSVYYTIEQIQELNQTLP